MSTAADVAAAILAAMVWTVGVAIVGGLGVLLAVIVALNVYELAVRLWRRVKRACDVLSWMDEV